MRPSFLQRTFLAQGFSEKSKEVFFYYRFFFFVFFFLVWNSWTFLWNKICLMSRLSYSDIPGRHPSSKILYNLWHAHCSNGELKHLVACFGLYTFQTLKQFAFQVGSRSPQETDLGLLGSRSPWLLIVITGKYLGLVRLREDLAQKVQLS